MWQRIGGNVVTPGPVSDLATFTAWVLYDNPNAVITNFVKKGNNIKCNVTNFTFIDFEQKNASFIGNFPNTLTYVNLGSNDLDAASLDILCQALLTNNVLESFNSSNQSTNAQPSSAKKTAISDLCSGNGGTATF